MTGAWRGRPLWLLSALLLLTVVAVPVAAWRTYWHSTPYDYSFSLHSRVLSPRVLGPLPADVAVHPLPANIDNCPDDPVDICSRGVVLTGPIGKSAVQLRDEVAAALVRNGWQRESRRLFPGQVPMRRPGTAFASVATAADEDAWDRSQGASGGPVTAIADAERSGRAALVVDLEYCGGVC